MTQNHHTGPGDTTAEPSTLHLRLDEAAFRAAVPEAVSGFPIVEVVRFLPGNPAGTYAAADVVTWNADGESYATHTLVRRDDLDRFPESKAPEWYVYRGHYELGGLAAARADALARS